MTHQSILYAKGVQWFVGFLLENAHNKIGEKIIAQSSISFCFTPFSILTGTLYVNRGQQEIDYQFGCECKSYDDRKLYKMEKHIDNLVN